MEQLHGKKEFYLKMNTKIDLELEEYEEEDEYSKYDEYIKLYDLPKVEKIR